VDGYSAEHADKMATIVFSRCNPDDVYMEFKVISTRPPSSIDNPRLRCNTAILVSTPYQEIYVAHAAIALDPNGAMLPVVMREWDVMAKTSEPKYQTPLAIADLNLFPHHSNTLQTYEGGKHMETLRWLAGDHLDQPDFRTLPHDRIPMENFGDLPTDAPSRFRFAVDEKKQEFSMCSSLGVASKGVKLLDTFLPIPGLPPVMGFTHEQVNTIYEKCGHPTGVDLMDHFIQHLEIP